LKTKTKGKLVKGIDKRIHKDGTVSYRARVRIKGHPVLIQSFASKTLATKWKRDTESAVEQGKYTYDKPGSKNTLADLIDRYFEKVLPSKPKNARNVRQHLLWWKQELGNYSLSDIKHKLIAQKREDLLSNLTCKNRPRSPTTIVRYLASLSHAFAIAVKDWEWIQENPVMKISKPKISNSRTRFLNDDEKERLLSVCRESESKGLYPIVILALSSGMRRGEIMNLKWRDIDLARGSILLQTTKNGEQRFIPLVETALDLLRSKYTNHAVDSLVFPSPNSPSKPIDIRSAWETAMSKADISNFRFHDLRHTAASYLAMSQASLLEIGTLLGHKTVQMTKRYAHLSNAHIYSAAETLNEKLFNLKKKY
jgi:integrase